MVVDDTLLRFKGISIDDYGPHQIYRDFGRLFGRKGYDI